jgi:hypothetical protein
VQAPALPPHREENGVRVEGRPEPRLVITPGRQEVPFHYGVVEADDLVTSHDLNTNPREDFAQALQPRGRENDANTINQMNKIANNMSPYELATTSFEGSATQGPPVIGKDRIVESGNGRTLGILKGYRDNTAASRAYRDAVHKTAASLGIDTAGMKNPVLVKMRENELNPSDRQLLANDMNGQTGLRFSSREQARTDVAAATNSPEGNIFARLEPTAQGSLAGNADFATGFARAVGSNELAGMVGHDLSSEITGEGAKRIRNAVVMYAYGDTALSHFLIEGDKKGLEPITNALEDSAAFFAKSRAMVERGELDNYYDPTPVIEDTLHNIKRIYTESTKLRGKDRLDKAYNAWDASIQTGTDSLVEGFGGKDESVYLTQAFMNRGPNGNVYKTQSDYTDFFREYNDLWQQNGNTGQTSLDFTEPVDRFSVIKMADTVAAGKDVTTVDTATRETPQPEQPQVQPPAPERSPYAMEDDDPETHADNLNARVTSALEDATSGNYTIGQALEEFGTAVDGIIEDMRHNRDQRFRDYKKLGANVDFGARVTFIAARELIDLATEAALHIAKGVTKFSDFKEQVIDKKYINLDPQQERMSWMQGKEIYNATIKPGLGTGAPEPEANVVADFLPDYHSMGSEYMGKELSEAVLDMTKKLADNGLLAGPRGGDSKSVQDTINQAKALIDKDGYLPSPEDMRKQGIDPEVIITAADMANRAYLESVLDLKKRIDVETDITAKETLQRQMLERSLMAATITSDLAGLATHAGRTLNMLKVLKEAAKVGNDEMKALDFYFGSRPLSAPEDAQQSAMNLPEPESAKALKETGTVPAVTGVGRARRVNRRTGLEGTSLLGAMEKGPKQPKARPALKSPSEIIAEDPAAQKRLQDLKSTLRDKLRLSGKMPTFSDVAGTSVIQYSSDVAEILAGIAKEYVKAGAKSFKEYRAALKKDMPGVEGSFTDEELRKSYTQAYNSEPVQAPAPRPMREVGANRPAQTISEPGLGVESAKEGVDLNALSRIETPTPRRQPGEPLPAMESGGTLLNPATANIESAVSRDQDVRPHDTQNLSMGDLGIDPARANLESIRVRDINVRPERAPGELLTPLEGTKKSLFAPPVDQYGTPRRQTGEEFPKESPLLTRENDELFDQTLRDATVSQERAAQKARDAQKERIESINRGEKKAVQPRAGGEANLDVPSLLNPGDALFNKETREPITPLENQAKEVEQTQRQVVDIVANSQAAKNPEGAKAIGDAVNAQTGMDGNAMGDTYVNAPPNEQGALIYSDLPGPDVKPIFLPEVAVRLQERLINTYKPPVVRHNPKGRTVQVAASGEKQVFRKNSKGVLEQDKTLEMLSYLGGYIYQQLPKAGKDFNSWAIRMNEAMGSKIHEDDLVAAFNKMQKKAVDITNEAVRYKKSAIKVARKVASVDGAAELLEEINKINVKDPDARHQITELIKKYAEDRNIGLLERLMGTRALMTSGDISAPYRQLLNYTVNPYYQFREIKNLIQKGEAPSGVKMLVAYNSGWLGKWLPKAGIAGDYAESLLRSIGMHKYANLMDRFRLALTELEGMSTDVALREEHYTTGIFDALDEAGYFSHTRTKGKSVVNFLKDSANVPAVFAARNSVKPAERAFAVYANLARVAMFEDWVDNLVKRGYDPDIDPEVFQMASDWINDNTGRGRLPKITDTNGQVLLDFEDNTKLLAAAFFSARFQMSRVKTMPILGLANIPARVGKGNLTSYMAGRMALENLGATAGGFGLMGSIYLFAKIAGWNPKIETDMRSSDFMKVVIGDTRIDVWGGYVQWMRYLAQMMTHQKKTESGRIEQLSPIHRTPTTPTITDTTRVFFAGKEAPFPAELWAALEGEDVIGNTKYRSDRGSATGFKDWQDVREHWEKGDALQTAKTKAILTDPNLLWDIGGNTLPMYAPEIRKSLQHSDGRAALLNLLQITGLGVQTFYRERHK